METPDIATLLHDITPVSYHPGLLLWFSKWSAAVYACLGLIALCLVIACIGAVRYYYRSDIRALRSLKHLERKCVSGTVDLDRILDRLVGVIRAYLGDVCGVQATAMAEDSLVHYVRELSLPADAQKDAERIFRMLVDYRFGRVNHSIQQVHEIIFAIRTFVHAVRSSHQQNA